MWLRHPCVPVPSHVVVARWEPPTCIPVSTPMYRSLTMSWWLRYSRERSTAFRYSSSCFILSGSSSSVSIESPRFGILARQTTRSTDNRTPQATDSPVNRHQITDNKRQITDSRQQTTDRQTDSSQQTGVNSIGSPPLCTNTQHTRLSGTGAS